MGSPLAPAMAGICMNWLTNEVFAKIKNPPVIMRYVDDLVLAFDNPNDIEYVYQIFNSIHPNLKFTKEEEYERKLPFLDVLITKTSHGIETLYKIGIETLAFYIHYIKSQHFQDYIPNGTAILQPNTNAI